tara:strand:- start:749 stop:901 length:153 start_codon:yes stop_codon:yes gene_type:complete
MYFAMVEGELRRRRVDGDEEREERYCSKFELVRLSTSVGEAIKLFRSLNI